MAIAALMANLGRVAVWWRDIDWRVAGVYAATAIPAAALGARTLIALDPRMIELTLGIFLLAMIPIRRWLLAQGLKIALWHMAIVGAGIGYIAGIVAATGPINTPFFLAYGLTRGAYLATEATGAIAINITKAIVFDRFGALPLETIARGVAVGGALTAGSWLAKRFVLAMDANQFRGVMDLLLAGAGLFMIASALSH